MHPSPEDFRLTAVLHALGDPARLLIVRRLADVGNLPCNQACETLPKSTLSHHFRVLREAGVIATRKDGTSHVNSLRRAELDQRFPGLLASVLASAAVEAAPAHGTATRCETAAE